MRNEGCRDVGGFDGESYRGCIYCFCHIRLERFRVGISRTPSFNILRAVLEGIQPVNKVYWDKRLTWSIACSDVTPVVTTSTVLVLKITLFVERV